VFRAGADDTSFSSAWPILSPRRNQLWLRQSAAAPADPGGRGSRAGAAGPPVLCWLAPF